MHFYLWDSAEGSQARVIAEDKRHVRIQDDYYHALVEQGVRKEHARTMAGYDRNKGACVNTLPNHLHPDRWVVLRAIEELELEPKDQPFASR